MLELEVIPERAIAAGQWQFVLGEFLQFQNVPVIQCSLYTHHSGMHLAQAVDILKRQCTVVKNVQLRYSDKVGGIPMAVGRAWEPTPLWVGGGLDHAFGPPLSSWE